MCVGIFGGIYPSWWIDLGMGVEIVELGDRETVVGSVTGSQGRMRSSVEARNSRKIGMGSKVLRGMIRTRMEA